MENEEIVLDDQEIQELIEEVGAEQPKESILDKLKRSADKLKGELQ
jgi:hypothetical protein